MGENMKLVEQEKHFAQFGVSQLLDDTHERLPDSTSRDDETREFFDGMQNARQNIRQQQLALVYSKVSEWQSIDSKLHTEVEQLFRELDRLKHQSIIANLPRQAKMLNF